MPYDPNHSAPRCPRCGYDVSGGVATWGESCPLTGLCPECGLNFEWADLLAPSRQRIPWLYEHAKHWWDVPRAWGTCFRALAPWWFWRRVKLHHTQPIARLAMQWPVALFGVFAGATLLDTALALLPYATAAGVKHLGPFNWHDLAALLTRLAGWSFTPGSTVTRTYDEPPVPTSLSVVVFALVAALIVSVGASEWRRTDARPRHLMTMLTHLLAPVGLFWAACLGISLVQRFVWVTNMVRSVRALRPPWLAPLHWLMRALLDHRSLALPGILVALAALSLWFALRSFLRIRAVWEVFIAATLGGAIAALAFFLLVR